MVRCRRARVLLASALLASLATAAGVAASPQSDAARQLGRQNTWSARSSSGAALTGTWTGSIDPNTGAASGGWTLLDANGRPAMRGGWSAVKSPGGWSGSWRANVVGSRAEFSGTWNATVDVKPNSPFADLFALALQNVVSGNWRAGTNSGSWSIRAYTAVSNGTKP